MSMSFRESRFSIALVWAMLPLTVFAGLPRMGCICASGEHKFFCERHRMAAGDGGCICCYGRPGDRRRTEHTTNVASAGEKACCKSKRLANQSRTQPTLCSGRPCRSVVDQTPLITAVKVVLEFDRAGHVPLSLAVVPTSMADTRVEFDRARDNLRPPPDLITTLGVLLI